MLRRIVFSGVAAGALFAVSVWAVGWPAVVAQNVPPSGMYKRSEAPSPASRTNEERSKGERLLAQASPTAPLPGARNVPRREVGSEPILIPAGRIRMIYVEDVPSQRDGVLMFIGTELQ